MKQITTTKIKKYREYLIEEEKSKNTIDKYMRDINAFTKWIAERELCKTVILEYKEHLKLSYAAKSVNSILSSLNSFFEFCEWHNLKVKLLKIQKQIFANESKELTKDEYDRLLNAALSKGNEKLYLLMQTICATGIRVSELQFITVESLRKRKANIDLKGKMRMVIIPNNLCKTLLKYASEQKITTGSVFISKNGKPLNRSNIWKMMQSLCDDANVSKSKVFPHNLRHLFAKRYYSLHKDIVRLADILGHTSVNTTRIYTMETGDIHRKQIQELGLLKC